MRHNMPCKDCPYGPTCTPKNPGPPCSGGIKKGEIVLISARTGVGKSILATNVNAR